jgi:undecaprenyl-diphosphatase
VFFAAFVGLFLVLWAIVYAALPARRRFLSPLAQAIVRNARVAKLVQRHGQALRDYWPVIVLVLLGAAVTAYAGDGFLDLAELVEAKSPALQQIDVQVHDWVITRRSPDATFFFVLMTNLGGPIGVTAIATLVTIALVVVRRYRWAIYLAVTAAGGGVADWELKRYFARARPAVAEMLRQAHGFSFPSGHAMGSTIVFGALAYLAFRALKQWRWQAAAIALAIVLVLAVALSRVYLGVHWVSDIGAGVSGGLVWLTAATVAYEVTRRIRRLSASRAAVLEARGRPG